MGFWRRFLLKKTYQTQKQSISRPALEDPWQFLSIKHARKKNTGMKSRRTPPILVDFAPINSSRKKPKPPGGDGGGRAG